jgi:hypothetical protein
VQDIVSEYWWDYFFPYVEEKTITSISTMITTSANKTITKHVTHLQTLDITYSYTASDGYNPFQLDFNNAPQPSEFIIADGLSGTQIVTGGVTVQSPAAFWVYSSVKVITVPAVTDLHGNLVCATTSQGTITGSVTNILRTTATNIVPASNGTSAVTKEVVHTITIYTETTSDIYTINGVNSNAEAYFGGHGIIGWTKQDFTTTGYDVRPAQTLTNPLGTATITAYTNALYDYIFHYVRSNGETFTYQPPTTGTVVTFPTPYIFQPPCETTDLDEFEPVCTHANIKEANGYVPQAVLDHMISDSAIRSMYPGIASCLLGGPSIILQNPAGDGETGGPAKLPYLQTHDPGLIPTRKHASDPISTALQTAAASSSIQPQAGPAQPLSQPADLPDSSNAAPSSNGLPVARLPASILGTTTVIGDSTFAVIPPTTMPVNPSSPISGSTIINQDGTFVIIPSSTTVAIPPALFVGVDISLPSNPLVPALPGSTILLPGETPAVVLSPGVTIPVNPAYSVEGYTQTVDGTAQVILTASTTLKLPQNIPTIPSLNGIATILPEGAVGVILPSGATVPVNRGYSVEGQTVTIDGTTEVILAASTTLKLPPQNEPTILSLPGITTILPGGAIGIILAAGATVPVNPAYSVKGQTTIIDSTTEVILPAPTTLRILPQKEPSIPNLTGITTILPGGETEVILPSGGIIPLSLDLQLSLSGRTTVIGGKTEVVLTAPATVPLPTETSLLGKTKSFHKASGYKSTGISIAANSTSLGDGKKTTVSSSMGDATGSSSQIVSLPSGSTAPSKKSGSARLWPGMESEAACWIGMILMWHIVA